MVLVYNTNCTSKSESKCVICLLKPLVPVWYNKVRVQYENTWIKASSMEKSTWTTKAGLAQMLKGGVIMDVVTPEQARIAEEAGAVAVMALERVPADIRAHGGVARMSDPEMIQGIIEAVTIPVMAKARIGHFVEAQVLAGARRRLYRRERSADAGRRRATISTSTTSTCRLCAAAATLARRCAALPRAPR